MHGLTGALPRTAAGVAALILSGTPVACARQPHEIGVSVGMPVKDLVSQGGARDLNIDLNPNSPDFWGTDDSIVMFVHLPSSNIRLYQEKSLGVYIHSSPNAIDGSEDIIFRIRYISAPVLGGIAKIPQGNSKISDLCREISEKMSDKYEYDESRSLDLSKITSWDNLEKANLSSYTAHGQHVAIGMRKGDSKYEYFYRICR